MEWRSRKLVSKETTVLFSVVGVDVIVSNIKRTLLPWKAKVGNFCTIVGVQNISYCC